MSLDIPKTIGITKPEIGTDKPDVTKTYLTGPQVSRRYGIDNRSLHRWRNDPDLNFPAAMIVHGRTFFAVEELDAWEKSRAAPSARKVA